MQRKTVLNINSLKVLLSKKLPDFDHLADNYPLILLLDSCAYILFIRAPLYVFNRVCMSIVWSLINMPAATFNRRPKMNIPLAITCC